MAKLQGTELVSIKGTQFADHDNLDMRITDVCLFQTMGEVVKKKENAPTVRDYFIWSLIFDAVFEQDMGVIAQIAQRIDGGVPDTEGLEGTASYFGSAINDILDMTNAEQVLVKPSDPCIIALAKVVVYNSLMNPGNNAMKRKNKNAAIEMILNRTGGRRTAPVRKQIETSYSEPDWMKGLPDGELL